MSDSDSTHGATKIISMEFNGPLYLHLSDISGASLIIQKLKGTENYNVWSCAIKLALQTKYKVGFIDELKETYDKVDASVTFNLYQQINSCGQTGQYFSSCYHKLNAMWRQFDETIKIEDTVKASKSFQDHNKFLKLMQFLMGMDEVYTPIRSHILTTDQVPNVKTAFSIISRDESL
ncbi:uncharacterized protein [Rutidosis leptorrhynchoides]|uniref:uncharacterized protein n=1 Tax=Rutidosis leptorrhynchoides TaxID=125765 RepID=UPI003A993FE8